MNGTLEITVAPKNAALAPETPVDVNTLDTAKPLAEIFQPFQTVLEKWEAKAAALVVTDISQKTEMAQAKLARLELKQARVAMDKTRKGLVEGLKARTGKIDETARIIRVKIEGLEESLRASEEFADRHAEKAKADLKVKREAELAPLLESPILGDLSDLSEGDFAKAIADAKLLRQAKIDAAAKAEADRIAKEAADERIAAENERLKAEAVETARLAEIERKKAADELAKQQAVAEKERQRIEQERAAERAKAEAEAKRLEAVRAEEKLKADEALQLALAKQAKEREAAEAEKQRLTEAARKELEATQAKAHAEAEKAAQEAAALKAQIEAKQKEEAAWRAKEEARIKADQAAAKKAASAPDKAKVALFAGNLRDMARLTLNDEPLSDAIWTKVNELADWCEATAEKL